MSLATRTSQFCTHHPKTVFSIVGAATLILVALALLPTLWPHQLSALQGVEVDTDPENMLSRDEPVRVFHNHMKKAFSLNDIIVVGVVNETHPQGVFNKDSLARVFELTEFAKTLQGQAVGSEDPGAGVVRADIIAPSTVDNIEQGGVGTVRFEWLMPRPPSTSRPWLSGTRPGTSRFSTTPWSQRTARPWPCICPSPPRT